MRVTSLLSTPSRNSGTRSPIPWCHWIAAILAAAVLIAGGCAKSQQRISDSGPVAKVHVNADGTIELNGQVVSLEQLRGELTKVQQSHGSVRYSRASPAGDPPPNAMDVLKTIVDLGLPVELADEPPR